jgi:hypothetical protein
MKSIEKNYVISDVLTKEEIDQIYERLESPYREYVKQPYGQQISDFWMPPSAINKIVEHCENITGIPGLILEAYQFSRYEKFVMADGTTSYPNLTPHYDNFEEPRFTFDYQISSNTSWPIVVEGVEFELEDNQAVTFSGTHQVHWRSKKIFEDGEFIDMIFCHLYLPGNPKNLHDHVDIMEVKQKKASKDFGELPWRM